jgi:hypothetical protein
MCVDLTDHAERTYTLCGQSSDLLVLSPAVHVLIARL